MGCNYSMDSLTYFHQEYSAVQIEADVTHFRTVSLVGNTLLSGFLAEATLSFILNISILWAMGKAKVSGTCKAILLAALPLDLEHTADSSSVYAETRFKTAGKLAPYVATIALVSPCLPSDRTRVTHNVSPSFYLILSC